MHSARAIDPDRVAIYIRWSTDDQSEGTTLAVQAERCRHFLFSQGWLYDDRRIYVDEGFSGGTLDRPALARLRADVRRGEVQCVVVYKIDRLSRSVIDIVDLVLKEWEGRCVVRSTTEEINTLTPTGKMFFYLLVSFAEYERNLIRERTMSGKVKRAEQGLNPGFRPPYGYRRGATAGSFVICEAEAALVRRAFALCSQGAGPGEIARALSQAQSGRTWTPLAVRRLLANPAYAGVLEYGRRRRRELLARTENAFPAIVDRQTWDAAQGPRSRQAAPVGRAGESPYLLSGLARCVCGATMTGKSTGTHRYYACSRRKREGKAACSAPHVAAGTAERAVAVQVGRVLTSTGAVASLTRAAAERRATEVQQRLRQVRRAQAALQARRKRLMTDYRGGTLPAELYAQELEALADEERKTAVVQERPVLSEVRLWDGLTSVQQRWLLGQVVVSITLSVAGEASILWREPMAEALRESLVQLARPDHLS